MEEPGDETMLIDEQEEKNRLPLSDDEQRALELYDRLQQLRLEIAIINAQHSLQNESEEELTPEAVDVARNELLDTRARYLLRNQIIDSVISANPILKAVHNDTEASPAERDLLPYILQRDDAAISVAKNSSTIGDIRQQSTRAQSNALRASRHNVKLAAEVMDLARQLKEKQLGYAHKDGAQQGIQKLQGELQGSRKKWRIIKGITAGVVAGSGVDWARDEVLCDLVLDPEDEDQ